MKIFEPINNSQKILLGTSYLQTRKNTHIAANGVHIIIPDSKTKTPCSTIKIRVSHLAIESILGHMHHKFIIPWHTDQHIEKL